MKEIRLLDCTLRDGGYCNNWEFGKDNIKSIVSGLLIAGIDIIELGYLSNKVDTNEDSTQFRSLEEANRFVKTINNNTIYCLMINFGDYCIDDIPTFDKRGVEAIRICFHKKNLKEALVFANKVKEKGYKIFIQDMLTESYNEKELSMLVKGVNQVRPYAFYIVDSFGMMKTRELVRLMYHFDKLVLPDICLGLHSHNNMQLAFANGLSFVQNKSNRSIIIDSTIYGMGRGAGNLNTELFIEYLNEEKNAEYNIEPLLKIIDEVLSPIFQKNYWGYSLPNYISAKNSAHPNYARFLDDKKTLTIEDMNKIFKRMDEKKKLEYDLHYIQKLYEEYFSDSDKHELNLERLKKNIKNKKILLIAPGKSSIEEKRNIIDFSNKYKLTTIAINFNYKEIDVDYIFVSNKRRILKMEKNDLKRCITTTNINEESGIKISYDSLTNNVEGVKDNAGLMAIQMMIMFGAKEIYLAGYDGYSHDDFDNYGSESLTLTMKNVLKGIMNKGMNLMLNRYAKEIKISFLTSPKCYSINNNEK